MLAHPENPQSYRWFIIKGGVECFVFECVLNLCNFAKGHTGSICGGEQFNGIELLAIPCLAHGAEQGFTGCGAGHAPGHIE